MYLSEFNAVEPEQAVETPQSHDWYRFSRGFYHYLYKCKNCNAVAIDFPEEHIPILCGTTKV